MEKSSLFVMRFGTVMLIALVAGCFPQKFRNIVMVVTLVHYVVAAIYSQKHLGLGTFKPLVVALLAIAAYLLYKFHVPITVVFGIHYVFTEVYLSYATFTPTLRHETRVLRTAALIFNFCAYLAILRNDHYFPLHKLPVLAAAMLSGFLYYGILFKMRFHLTPSQAVSVSFVENFSLLILFISFFVPLNLFYFIGYHVVFWSMYPLPGIAKKQRLVPYFAINIALLLVSYVVSPLGLKMVSPEIWQKLFIVAGLAHITTSLALTRAQPGWITKIFALVEQKQSASAAMVPAMPISARK